jgi:GT2 family glycosyltransferase
VAEIQPLSVAATFAALPRPRPFHQDAAERGEWNAAIGATLSALHSQHHPPRSALRSQLSTLHTFAEDWRAQNDRRWQYAERLGGFCLLIKREVLTKIGRDLDEASDLGLFDSDILSTKIRQAGYQLAVCRDLFIHHFGTRTFAHGAPG